MDFPFEIILTIHEAMSRSPGLCTLGGTLLGWLIGHRLNLGRDRRNEYNVTAAPVRAWIVGQIDHPSPMRASLSAIELDAFMQCLSRRRRVRFEADWQAYQQAHQKATARGELGGVYYVDTAPILRALQNCLKHTYKR